MSADQWQPVESEDTAAHPPTEAGEMFVPERGSRWPTVIGVIAIVLGVAGTLGGAWGALWPLVMGKAGNTGKPEYEVMEEWASWSGLGSVLALAAALLLLFAGIGLVRRTAGSPGLMRTWAIVKMVVVLLNIAVAYQVQKAMFDAMEQNAQGIGMPGNTASIVVGSTVVFGLLWGWALPIFVLIWFSRAKIKAEVADWD